MLDFILVEVPSAHWYAQNYQCSKFFKIPETSYLSIVTAEFNSGNNSLSPTDFTSILKNRMKVEDATAADDFYDDCRFLEVEPLLSLKKLTSLQIKKGSKNALKFIKNKLNGEKWTICDVANHKCTLD